MAPFEVVGNMVQQQRERGGNPFDLDARTVELLSGLGKDTQRLSNYYNGPIDMIYQNPATVFKQPYSASALSSRPTYSTGSSSPSTAGVRYPTTASPSYRTFIGVSGAGRGTVTPVASTAAAGAPGSKPVQQRPRATPPFGGAPGTPTAATGAVGRAGYGYGQNYAYPYQGCNCAQCLAIRAANAAAGKSMPPGTAPPAGAPSAAASVKPVAATSATPAAHAVAVHAMPQAVSHASAAAIPTVNGPAGASKAPPPSVPTSAPTTAAASASVASPAAVPAAQASPRPAPSVITPAPVPSAPNSSKSGAAA